MQTAVPSAVLTMSGLGVRFGGDLVVDGVDLEVGAGESVGLIGFSGSGKTLTALAALGLLPAEARTSGQVTLRGLPVLGSDVRTLRRLWGREVAFVGQDALTALNPLATVGRQLRIPLRRHRGLSGRALAAAAAEVVEQVELPAGTLAAYPGHMSGGQRQRVAIALAMACRPALLIADEPTSSLDVVTQAGILALLGRLAEQGVALLLISHDIAVVAQVCARLVVLDKGRIVEQGRTREVLAAPVHPRTAELVSAARVLSSGARLE
jgi:peptide/nickel transport system ATP-binding protein